MRMLRMFRSLLALVRRGLLLGLLLYVLYSFHSTLSCYSAALLCLCADERFRLLDIKSSRPLPLRRISRPVHLLVECVDNCEYSNRIGVGDLLMS